MLNALEACGVDNWGGYSRRNKYLREQEEEQKRETNARPQAGTCSGSSAVERPCQRGLRAGSIRPTGSTAHARRCLVCNAEWSAIVSERALIREGKSWKFRMRR